MEQWVWFVIIPLGLLLIYVLFFYLGSMFQRGSLLRLWLDYYADSIRQALGSLTSRLKTLPPKQAAPQEAHPLASPAMPNSRPVGPQPASPRPQTMKPVSPKPAASKPAIVKKTLPPAAKPVMTVPTTEPLPYRIAKKAARERQRLWIKYRNEEDDEEEEKIEIYRAAIGGGLWVWCCFRHTRSILSRNRIVAWRLLDERFERSPHLEQCARWGDLIYLPSWLGRMFQK